MSSWQRNAPDLVRYPQALSQQQLQSVAELLAPMAEVRAFVQAIIASLGTPSWIERSGPSLLGRGPFSTLRGKMPDGKRFVPRPTTEKQQVANLTKLVALHAGTESHMARLATLHGKSVTIATGSTLPLQSFSARNRVGRICS